MVWTGGQSWARLLQVQLRVQELFVSFSWQGANRDVDIINSAVTVEPSVQEHRQRGFMVTLNHALREKPKAETLKHFFKPLMFFSKLTNSLSNYFHQTSDSSGKIKHTWKLKCFQIIHKPGKVKTVLMYVDDRLTYACVYVYVYVHQFSSLVTKECCHHSLPSHKQKHMVSNSS